jgi:hypothetical protein
VNGGHDGVQLDRLAAFGVHQHRGLEGAELAITGDFVLLADEVNPVLRTLRANNIEVTALHSHMLNDEPRLFFMHFWANADAVTLAKGVREALDKTKGKRG